MATDTKNSPTVIISKLVGQFTDLFRTKPNKKLSPEKDNQSARSPSKSNSRIDMPPLNPINFYYYYIPQYAKVLYRHKQIAYFTAWAFSELVRTLYYPVLQYHFMLWDQTIFDRNPITELLPVFIGAVTLGNFIDTCSDYLRRQLRFNTKDSINQSLLVECIHTNKGADIIGKDNKRSYTNPMDVNAKYSYMSHYIENIGSLCLMAVISPFTMIPTLYSIVQHELLLAAAYTVAGCGILTYLANLISKHSSYYINDIAIAQSDTRNLIEQLSENGHHNHPNARAVSRENTKHLVKSLSVSRRKYNQVESFVDLVSSSMIDLCKAIIGGVLIYPSFYAKKITLEHYTFLVATLSSIPNMFSRYISSNTGLNVLQQGASVMNHFEKRYLDETKTRNTAEKRLPSYYSGSLKYNYTTTDKPRLSSVGVTISQENTKSSTLDVDLSRQHLVVMGANGAGKSTFFRIIDGSYPRDVDNQSKPPICVSVAQSENLEGDDLVVAMCKFWPFDVPLPKVPAGDNYKQALSHKIEFTDYHGKSLDKQALLDSICETLYALEFQHSNSAAEIKNNLCDKPLTGLSGGEKSLILFALVSTIVKYASHDSPTLVLMDEIRAPIDERRKAIMSDLIHNLLDKHKHVYVAEIIHDSKIVQDTMKDHSNNTSCAIVSRDGNKISIEQMNDYNDVLQNTCFRSLTGMTRPGVYRM